MRNPIYRMPYTKQWVLVSFSFVMIFALLAMPLQPLKTSAQDKSEKPTLVEFVVPEIAPPAPVRCTSTAFPTVTNSTPVAISAAAPSVVTSTINIAGAQTYLYDVDVITNITHINNTDLDITLTSPTGTVVTLSTDNGGTLDNIFAGTTWDDDADPDGIPPATRAFNANQVQKHPYANLTDATPLAPEEALAGFIGEDPNGVWTLTISDDTNLNGGTLNSWSLNLTTLSSVPSTVTAPTVSNTTPVPISAVGTSVVTSTIPFTTTGTSIFEVNLSTNISHTFNNDLEFALTSPAGTTVTLSNGLWAAATGDVDNVYAGTTWDDDGNPLGQVPYATNVGLSSDHPYVNNIVVPLLAPVEGLGAFIGENPNGTWTLTIADQVNLDGGALNNWSLTISTATCTLTAAGVEVSGKIMTPEGRGLRNARVWITGPNGVTRGVTTGTFGYYRFQNVEAGWSYVIGVDSKRYRFSSQVFQILDNVTGLDFTAEL